MAVRPHQCSGYRRYYQIITSAAPDNYSPDRQRHDRSAMAAASAGDPTTAASSKLMADRANPSVPTGWRKKVLDNFSG